jgi:hypothetical protein
MCQLNSTCTAPPWTPLARRRAAPLRKVGSRGGAIFQTTRTWLQCTRTNWGFTPLDETKKSKTSPLRTRRRRPCASSPSPPAPRCSRRSPPRAACSAAPPRRSGASRLCQKQILKPGFHFHLIGSRGLKPGGAFKLRGQPNATRSAPP